MADLSLKSPNMLPAIYMMIYPGVTTTAELGPFSALHSSGLPSSNTHASHVDRVTVKKGFGHRQAQG